MSEAWKREKVDAVMSSPDRDYVMKRLELVENDARQKERNGSGQLSRRERDYPDILQSLRDRISAGRSQSVTANMPHGGHGTGRGAQGRNASQPSSVGNHHSCHPNPMNRLPEPREEEPRARTGYAFLCHCPAARRHRAARSPFSSPEASSSKSRSEGNKFNWTKFDDV